MRITIDTDTNSTTPLVQTDGSDQTSSQAVNGGAAPGFGSTLTPALSSADSAGQVNAGAAYTFSANNNSAQAGTSINAGAAYGPSSQN